LPKDSRQKPDFALTTSLKFLLASLGLAIDHFYGAKNSTFGFGTKTEIAQVKKNLKTGAFCPHQNPKSRFSSENRCYSWKFSGNSTQWCPKLLRTMDVCLLELTHPSKNGSLRRP